MITLSTIIYEGNFRKILKSDSWFLNYNSKYISKKRLNINNIQSITEFESLLKEINNDIEVCYVRDKAEEANEYFKLNTNLDTYGYNYIMGYFTDLITINTDYVFNVASDCQNDIVLKDDFFEKSIDILKSDDVLVVTIPWFYPKDDYIGIGEQDFTNTIDEKDNKSKKINDDFWFSKIMCDQVFITKIEKLKKCDFTITNNLHPYPAYGGLSFEMRLGNYIMTNNKYRAIIKGYSYYLHGKD